MARELMDTAALRRKALASLVSSRSRGPAPLRAAAGNAKKARRKAPRRTDPTRPGERWTSPVATRPARTPVPANQTGAMQARYEADRTARNRNDQMQSKYNATKSAAANQAMQTKLKGVQTNAAMRSKYNATQSAAGRAPAPSNPAPKTSSSLGNEMSKKARRKASRR